MSKVKLNNKQLVPQEIDNKKNIKNKTKNDKILEKEDCKKKSDNVETSENKKPITSVIGRFEEDRNNTFKKIKEMINYNENERYFTSIDMNKEEIQKKIKEEIYKDVCKYFAASVWKRIDINTQNSHYTIIKNVFKYFGFVITIKKNYVRNEKGGNTIWYQYCVMKKITDIVIN